MVKPRTKKRFVVESKNKKGKWDPIGIELRSTSKTAARAKINGLIKQGHITNDGYKLRAVGKKRR